MSDILNRDQHLIKDPPLVEGDHTFGTITDKISSIDKVNKTTVSAKKLLSSNS